MLVINFEIKNYGLSQFINSELFLRFIYIQNSFFDSKYIGILFYIIYDFKIYAKEREKEINIFLTTFT